MTMAKFRRIIVSLLALVIMTSTASSFIYTTPASAALGDEVYKYIDAKTIGAYVSTGTGVALIRTYISKDLIEISGQKADNEGIYFTASSTSTGNGSICSDSIYYRSNSYARVTRTEQSAACQKNETRKIINVDQKYRFIYFSGQSDGSLAAISGRVLVRVTSSNVNVYVENSKSATCPLMLFENPTGKWALIAAEENTPGSVDFDSQGRTTLYQQYAASVLGQDTYGNCQIGADTQRELSRAGAASLLGGTTEQWATGIRSSEANYLSIKPGDTNHDGMPFSQVPIKAYSATADQPVTNCNVYTNASLREACQGGLKNDGAKYCSSAFNLSYPADTPEAPERIAACVVGQRITADGGEKAPVGECIGVDSDCAPPPPVTSSCAVPSIGWIICPVMGFMGSITDGMYGLVAGLLVTDTKTVSATSGTYTAWSAMRNFANVGFVIVFLIIIISQISNIGVTNYGVKKTLPRLIIVAILVNVSFFLCQIAIDISNIVGGSLPTLFTNIAVFDATNDPTDFGTIGGGILAGTIATGAGVGAVAVISFANVGLLIPVLLGALLAIVITLGILALRQVLVILLVVIAPLAFLAMLLPNTENLFKQWRKIIVAMLLIYPMIAVLFGASKLASSVIVASTEANSLQQLFGLAAMFLPLFLVPVLLKNSLNAIPAIGNLATKLQNRANGLVGKSGKELYNSTAIARGMATRKQKRSEFHDQRFAENLEKGGVTGLMARGIPGLNKITKAGRYANKALSRSALGATEKADDDDLKFQKVAISRAASEIQRGPGGREAGIEYARQQLATSIQNKDSVGARAAFDYLKSTGQMGLEAASSTIAQNRNGDAGTMTSLARHIDVNHGDVKASDNRLKNWASGDAKALDAHTDKDANGKIIYGTGVVGNHLNGLTDAEIGSQTAESLASGNITAAQATAILNNTQLLGSLKPGAKDVLINHFGGIPPK